MAQKVNQSPFTTPAPAGSGGVYAAPQSTAFSAPPLGVHDGYADTPNASWAPKPIGSPYGGVAQGNALATVYPAGAPPTRYYGQFFANWRDRHSVEQIDANGATETRPQFSYSAMRAPDPRWTPKPVGRVTADLMPRNYFFLRPVDSVNLGARQLSGNHFSMADHVRQQQTMNRSTLGTQPVKGWRNTMRLDPTPWDTGSGDVNADTTPPVTPARVQVVDLQPSMAATNRSWRL